MMPFISIDLKNFVSKTIQWFGKRLKVLNFNSLVALLTHYFGNYPATLTYAVSNRPNSRSAADS